VRDAELSLSIMATLNLRWSSRTSRFRACLPRFHGFSIGSRTPDCEQDRDDDRDEDRRRWSRSGGDRGIEKQRGDPWVHDESHAHAGGCHIEDYESFALDVLSLVPDLPISFEVFSDDFDDMERQARKISS
jgi:hypothetical protein